MRSLRPLAFALAPVGVLAGAGAAAAQPPDWFAFAEQDPGVIDCGGFEDHFTDFFDVKAPPSLVPRGTRSGSCSTSNTTPMAPTP